jgi:hypothetical protein
MNQLNVSAVILSWVNTSDENAALQWLPSSAPSGNGTYDCPTLYVGNSTGERIRGLIRNNQISNMSVVLDAPSLQSPTYTLIGHLNGTGNSNRSILLYTHSQSQPWLHSLRELLTQRCDAHRRWPEHHRREWYDDSPDESPQTSKTTVDPIFRPADALDPCRVLFPESTIHQY